MKSLILSLLILISFATKAQTSLFVKTVDSINVIIKANPLTYYMPERQYDAFVKKISVNYDGIITFTDSIAPEIKSTNSNKIELISDCCPSKKTRTLDVLTIKKWDIHFPTATYLKDENEETIGRIIGLKQVDLKNLKTQFDLLQSLCLDYKKAYEEAKDKELMIKYRCDLPDAKRKAAAEAAMKKADELNENNKN